MRFIPLLAFMLITPAATGQMPVPKPGVALTDDVVYDTVSGQK